MKKVLLFLIKFYQINISPTKISGCRFTPTCSNYAKEAIIKHGSFFGIMLFLWRFVRCNPFSKGGYDPVPETLFFNHKGKKGE